MIVFIILFFFLDLASTVLFLSTGGIELNPLWHLYGWSGIIVIKMCVICAVWGLLWQLEKVGWVHTVSIFYKIIVALSLIVVISNIMLYLTGKNIFQILF